MQAAQAVQAAIMGMPDIPAIHGLAQALGECAPEAAAAIRRCLKVWLLPPLVQSYPTGTCYVCPSLRLSECLLLSACCHQT